MSVDLSPDGMNVISDKTLVPLSNIIIDIYVKKIKADHTGKLEIIRVEGEVIWGKHFPHAPSIMGIRFNNPNKGLVRIYKAKKPRSK